MVDGYSDASENPAIARYRARTVTNYFASRPRIKAPSNTPEPPNQRVEITCGS
jgi:hypothetical protein